MTHSNIPKLPNLDDPVEWLTHPGEIAPASWFTLRARAVTRRSNGSQPPRRPCSDCPLRKHDEAQHV